MRLQTQTPEVWAARYRERSRTINMFW